MAALRNKSQSPYRSWAGGARGGEIRPPPSRTGLSRFLNDTRSDPIRNQLPPAPAPRVFRAPSRAPAPAPRPELVHDLGRSRRRFIIIERPPRSFLVDNLPGIIRLKVFDPSGNYALATTAADAHLPPVASRRCASSGGRTRVLPATAAPSMHARLPARNLWSPEDVSL
ncbi:hypothetical protein EVAR_7670_1 [Eumeta japonica]|uniref:Uncharacterized protein n=1 Tax=Eumeta variegata TaxID=151549 RepID=A0A4C1TLC6_EUMVA|nr:hypothetical protein EVAR_7670_1 [Eumeta japonica]